MIDTGYTWGEPLDDSTSIVESGDTASSSPYAGAIDSLSKVATSVLTLYQQKQLMDINASRAAQGLPPIDTSRYTAAGVQVGLSPQTRSLVMLGGLIALGVALIMRGGR